MSVTADFSFDGSTGVRYIGSIADFNGKWGPGQGGRFEVQFTGTDLDFQWDYGTWTVVVDGVPQADLVNGTLFNTIIASAVSGLANTAHVAVLTLTDDPRAYYYADVFKPGDGWVFRTSGSGFTAFTDGVACYPIGNTSNATHIRYDGAFQLLGIDLVPSELTPVILGSQRFRGKPSQIALAGVGVGAGDILLYRDGVFVAQSANAAVAGVRVVESGLDTTTLHDYELLFGKLPDGNFVNWRVGALITTGATGVDMTHTVPTRECITMVISDSIATGPSDSEVSWPRLIWEHYVGVGDGKSVCNYSQGGAGLNLIPQAVLQIPTIAPSNVQVALGTNSVLFYASTASPAYSTDPGVIASAAALQRADWDDQLDTLLTAFPSTPIYLHSLIDNSETYWGPWADAFDAALQDAITANGDPNLHFVNYRTVLVAGTSDYADSTHPSLTGIVKMANKALLELDPTDTTPPTLTTKVISSDGATLTLTFSEAVDVATTGDFTLSGGHVPLDTEDFGSGDSQRTFDLIPVVAQSETITISYASTEVKDMAGNELATFSGAAVTNNSTLTVPGAPVLTSDNVEAAEGGIQVSPQAPASNGGSAIIAYEVWRNRNSAGYALRATILNANLVDGYFDTGTVVGEEIKYKVKCYNAIGYSAFSAERTVTSQGPGQVGSGGSARMGLSIGMGIGM